ncbi:metallophosphoesterase (plasmid) [Halorutilales archaeon Cl-col2-1]
MRELADGDLTAVKGNIDSGGLGLPEVSTLEVEDVKFVVTHGTGDLTNYQERVAETVKSNRADSDSVKTVGVSGHTHETLDTRVDGIRILNPGTVTGADPASEASMMTAEVDSENIDVSLHIED